MSNVPSSVLTARLKEALAAHERGQFDAAAAGYRDILAQQPRHFDALHLLGVLHMQRGDTAEAEQLIGKAVRIKSDYVPALSNLGLLLRARGRPEEALKHFNRAISLQPNAAETQYNRALTLLDVDRAADALAGFDCVMALVPTHIGAALGRGNALSRLGRGSEALIAYDHAETLQPGNAEVAHNRAIALRDMGDRDEALRQFDRALTLAPSSAEIHYSRAVLLLALGRAAEALAGFDRATALDPNHVNAHVGRGNALERLGRGEDAIAAYDQASALRPNDAEIVRNRAVALHNLGRIEEARTETRRALQVKPDFAEAHVLLAESLLLTGDFGDAWPAFEWRWRTAGLASQARTFGKPQWRGEDIAGRTILLHGEQGFGDMIQFSRFIGAVAARGARVLVEMPAELTPLMVNVPGAAQVFARGEVLPPFDLQCPLMSLPLALGAEALPERTSVPYLTADPTRVAEWSARLGTHRPRHIGLAWAGRATHINDHNRSLALAALTPLLARDDITFIALSPELRTQDAEAAAKAINLLRPEIGGFADTAAIVAAVDLVITVDTVFAHLAGALGKPAWVLLPFVPDWRWQLGRSDSPWYATARLFRQPARGDWASAIAAVNAAL